MGAVADESGTNVCFPFFLCLPWERCSLEGGVCAQLGETTAMKGKEGCVFECSSPILLATMYAKRERDQRALTKLVFHRHGRADRTCVRVRVSATDNISAAPCSYANEKAKKRKKTATAQLTCGKGGKGESTRFTKKGEEGREAAKGRQGG